MRTIHKRKLSPLDCTRLRPKAKSFLVWDSLERGLALQVRPSGHRAFKFIYNRHGKTRWVTIGQADTVSLALARETATRLRLEVHHGKDPAGPRATGPRADTFAVIANRYLEEYAKKKNKSWRQADTLITKYVLPMLGERDASSLTRADARAMLAHIDGPVMQNQVLASTSAVAASNAIP